MHPSKPGDGGMFIFLPDNITARIFSWQSRFKEYVKMPKPHLTIMYPPFLTKEEWKNYRKSISDIMRQFSPFTVRFTETGFFSDPFFLYMAPADCPELYEMNTRLVSLCPEKLQGLNLKEFIPHVSIGTFPTKESVTEAKLQLKEFMSASELSFTVKEIFFTALDDDFRWKIYDIISITGSEC